MKLTCKKCGREQDSSEFYRNKNSKTGYVIYCKTCMKNIRLERIAKQKELKNFNQKEEKIEKGFNKHIFTPNDNLESIKQVKDVLKNCPNTQDSLCDKQKQKNEFFDSKKVKELIKENQQTIVDVNHFKKCMDIENDKQELIKTFSVDDILHRLSDLKYSGILYEKCACYVKQGKIYNCDTKKLINTQFRISKYMFNVSFNVNIPYKVRNVHNKHNPKLENFTVKNLLIELNRRNIKGILSFDKIIV